MVFHFHFGRHGGFTFLDLLGGFTADQRAPVQVKSDLVGFSTGRKHRQKKQKDRKRQQFFPHKISSLKTVCRYFQPFFQYKSEQGKNQDFCLSLYHVLPRVGVSAAGSCRVLPARPCHKKIPGE